MKIYISIYGKPECVVDTLRKNKSVGNNTSCTSLCGVSATLLVNIDVCVCCADVQPRIMLLRILVTSSKLKGVVLVIT